MLINGINPFIDNLKLIVQYGKTEFKIINDGQRIIKDKRYLQGMVRYFDSSGLKNIQKMKFIIMDTYLHICLNISIPIKDNNHLFKDKLEKYLLILDSLEGLDKFSKKYKLYEQQQFILSVLLPNIKEIYKKNFK